MLISFGQLQQWAQLANSTRTLEMLTKKDDEETLQGDFQEDSSGGQTPMTNFAVSAQVPRDNPIERGVGRMKSRQRGSHRRRSRLP